MSRVLMAMLLAITAIMLVIVLVKRAKSQNKETFYSWDVDYLNQPGDMSMDDSCAVKTNSSDTYVMHNNTFLERHPHDPNACLLRRGLREPGVMDDALSQCNSSTGPLRAVDVDKETGTSPVSSIGVEAVNGQQRCVVRLNSGLDATTYNTYEDGTRTDIIKNTEKYIELRVKFEKLKIKYNAILAEISALERERVEIDKQYAAQEQQLADYNKQLQELEAKEAAINNKIAAAKQSAADFKSKNESMQNSMQKDNKDLLDAQAKLKLAQAEMDSIKKLHPFIRIDTHIKNDFVVRADRDNSTKTQYQHVTGGDWSDQPQNVWAKKGPLLVNVHHGTCLDVYGGGTKRETDIIHYQCHGHANQQWDTVGDTIRPRHVNNMCLDLYAFRKDNGAKVVTWDCNGKDNQKWRQQVV
jgi:hypothetical protein